MLNMWTFSGRATADPTIFYTESGKVVANARVACDTYVGGQKNTIFVSVKAWDKTAEKLSEYIKKGTKFQGCGPLVIEEWEKDGQKRQQFVCHLTQLDLGARVAEPEYANAQ